MTSNNAIFRIEVGKIGFRTPHEGLTYHLDEIASIATVV